MFVTIISTSQTIISVSQQKMKKNKNIDYYFCITSMQKIKKFIKICFLKEFWFTKLFRKAASLKIQVRYDKNLKTSCSYGDWLFFKTFKCVFKTQNSWHFFCNTDTVCCLQKLFHLGWLGSHLKLNGCKLLNSFSDQFPYYKISTHVP